MTELFHKNNYTSLENALRALKSFSEDNPEFGVSELADKLGIGISTTHRILTTLAEEDFVVKNPESNKYTLGLSILQLTNTVTEQLHIIRESTPILHELTEKTGESSHIGILDGGAVIYLQKVDGFYPVKLESHLGKRNPIHCTSSGQAILSFLEGDLTEWISLPLSTFTTHTITDPEALQNKLDEIRQKGYAICDQEFESNIYSIGAPVYSNRKNVAASINIAGPSQRIKPYEKAFSEHVIKAGRQLSTIIQKRRGEKNL
ncbi:IclR family transcriptional regulator [Salibacterium sp. K-3]